MRRVPTKEQIAKLPVWAREYLVGLARERDVAIDALNKWGDSQTKSPVSVPEYVCDGERTRYVNDARHIRFTWAGVGLDVYLTDPEEIRLQWSGVDRGLADICMQPYSFQSIRLKSKESMRL
jgi:hypothetical protein